MKIEYLPNGSPECPVLRLFDFLPDEASTLRTLFMRLAEGHIDLLQLDSEPGFTSVAGVQLLLRVAEHDSGVSQLDSHNAFELALTRGTFEDLAELSAPLCSISETRAFQWLLRDGRIKLLLSPTGGW